MAVNFTVQNTRTSEYRFFPEDITIVPELNGRYEKPDIKWLIADILSQDSRGNIKGQTQPCIIRNDGGLPVLVAGFSRWRAISAINEQGLVPVKMAVRCTYNQCSEFEAFKINISENRFRNPTTPLDDAHNINRLIKYGMVETSIAEIYFPTAKTESELRDAVRFVNERISLLTLTPAVETEVRAGRVTESAMKAIAKMSEKQQAEVIKKEGKIERKDVVPAAVRVPKPPAKDAELLRRCFAVLEDVSGLLDDPDPEFDYVEVERNLLINLRSYVEELKAK